MHMVLFRKKKKTHSLFLTPGRDITRMVTRANEPTDPISGMNPFFGLVIIIVYPRNI